MGRDDLVAIAAYQPEPTAVAAARRFVRDTLGTWLVAGTADGHGLVDDAVLLTSELVTNAVVHAGTEVQVTCKIADGAVEVMVLDHQPARFVPESAALEADPGERTSGRGLLLPAALASTWGISYGRAAKAVWFRLGLGAALAESGTVLSGPPDDMLDERALTALLSPAGPDQAGPAHAGLAHAGLAGDGMTGAGLTGADGGAPLDAAPAALGGPPETRGYHALLLATVESARTAAGADAAVAVTADEDGDLRVRTVAGHLPQPPVAGGGPDESRSSVLTVPIMVDGRVAGLLSVMSRVADKFGESDAAVLQRIADTSGPALQQAWAAELERARRARLAALAHARGLLTQAGSEAEIMTLAGDIAVPKLVPWCAVLLRSGPGLGVAFARHADGARAAALDWVADALCEPMAAELATWGWEQPGWGRRCPLPAAVGTSVPSGVSQLLAGSAWCFPLGEPGAALGVLVVGADDRMPREVAALAGDLASRIGLALTTTRLVSQER